MPFDYGKTERTKHKGAQKVSTKPKNKKMVRNTDGGGFVFKTKRLEMMDRFLVLGSEKPSYYVGEGQLTLDNAKNIRKLIAKRPGECLERILEMSESGRCPKNDPAIFAFSLFFKYAPDEWKTKASYQANRILRTFTHLTTFMNITQQFTGTGRAIRRVLSRWYNEKDVNKIMYQYLKYGQRAGWTHKDMITVGHVDPKTEDLSMLFGNIFGKVEDKKLAKRFPAFALDAKLKCAKTAKEVIRLIDDNRVQFEQVPTQFLKDPGVWNRLLPSMGYIAMTRSLGRMGACNTLGTFSDAEKLIIKKLNNVEDLRRSKIHPVQLLSAMMVYGAGHGARGNLSWVPNKRIVNALDDAFVESFGNVPSTGLNWMMGLDVSGSMTWGDILGIPGLKPYHVTAVMAMVTAKNEPSSEIFGFSNGLQDLGISSKDSIGSAMKKVQKANFGSTNPGALVQHAIRSKIPVDVFYIITDSEINSGRQPYQLLKTFRQKVGKPDAKMIVMATEPTRFSIADPDDGGMLDMVGFDAAAPRIIAEFAKSGF